jgi:hypothetical protein
VVAPPQALTFDDEDDDLPRPGKVWDNSGPSLKELLALEQAKNQAEAAPPPAADAPKDDFANVEPVGEQDATSVWKSLLDLVSTTYGAMLHSLVAGGNFAGIEDGAAVIRYSRKNDTFAKLLERNGKKDLVRDSFAKVLGRPVALRLVIDDSIVDAEPQQRGASPNGSPAAPRPAASAPARPAAPAPPPEPAAPAGPPPVRITPELIEEMKKSSLVGSIMDKFNAAPVKVELQQ